MRNILIILVLILFNSCTGKTPKSSTGVVVTNAWTAAYAEAAGAKNITVLAPYDMVHPSEYELRPGDIEKIKKAELIIYAGYEVMVDQIKTGLEVPDEKLVLITTNYKYADIAESVMRIAKLLGTEEFALANLVELYELFEQGKEAIHDKSIDNQHLILHFFQKSFIEELGITSFTIFGPAPPEPRQILSVSKSNADIIIDNAHNPVGHPFKETLKDAEHIMLLNFPGMYGTSSIADVIEYNLKELIKIN
jgi:zinc transport system substrate-binding protein